MASARSGTALRCSTGMAKKPSKGALCRSTATRRCSPLAAKRSAMSLAPTASRASPSCSATAAAREHWPNPRTRSVAWHLPLC